LTAQGAPVAALQAPATQLSVAHWSPVMQPMQVPITQRPVAHAESTVHVAPEGARQSSCEQSRHRWAMGSQVGWGPPTHSASVPHGVKGTPVVEVALTPSPEVAPPLPPAPLPPLPAVPHWRRSAQRSGAKRHPRAVAAAVSASRATKKAPRRALGEGIARW
jgi:hypothetical protein